MRLTGRLAIIYTIDVSIHAPWEGCDLVFLLIVLNNEFQFTHPGKGATGQQARNEGVQECFNSRTLGRVRQEGLYDVKLAIEVSIHAPWEGCDGQCFQCHQSGQSFNSRTLGRVRRRTQPHIDIEVRVSIHAPWEGCDVAKAKRL